MKQLITALLLSVVTNLCAANYGDYSPGTSFTLKVSQRQTTCVFPKTRKTINNVPVPADVPNFKTGTPVRFRIGPNGQLIAKGMSIPYAKSLSTPGYATAYKSETKTRLDSATVHRFTGTEIDFAMLTFVRTGIKDGKIAVTTVTYALDK